MMRQTPTQFLKKDGGLPTLTQFHTKLTHCYIHHRLAAQDSHPIKRIIQKELFEDVKHFHSPIHEILLKEHLQELNNMPLEIRMQHTILPWADPLPTPRNLNTPKEEVAKKIKTQLQEEADNNSLIMFTDGSLIEGRKAGAAVYAPHTHLTLKLHLGQGKTITNYETELTALWFAATTAQAMLNPALTEWSGLAIFSDSQAALKAICKPNAKSKAQHLCLKIYKTLTALQERRNLTLYWCPGHSSVPENEKVDTLAKQAADNHPTSIQDTLPQSLSRLCQATKKKTMEPTKIADPSRRYPFRSDPKKMHNALATWDRGIASLFFKLRSGHVPLNQYLFNIKRSITPLCQSCKRPETVAHFLIFCPTYRRQRLTLRHELVRKRVRLDFNNHHQLLDLITAIPVIATYIINTNRFPEHKVYNQVPFDRGKASPVDESLKDGVLNLIPSFRAR
ncbi:hypothetical protein O181_061877 [Austropuccinia psidii MF-1]|uniref:ribonuclease H n=1 Tax=Austropuccinia psidii MF-1 TaxID=1389203 RepID=A0A9Q3HZU7_9BASI|nr:hypothetical protein [Austropuccinia psidii MF-1]